MKLKLLQLPPNTRPIKGQAASSRSDVCYSLAISWDQNLSWVVTTRNTIDWVAEWQIVVSHGSGGQEVQDQSASWLGDFGEPTPSPSCRRCASHNGRQSSGVSLSPYSYKGTNMIKRALPSQKPVLTNVSQMLHLQTGCRRTKLGLQHMGFWGVIQSTALTHNMLLI